MGLPALQSTPSLFVSYPDTLAEDAERIVRGITRVQGASRLRASRRLNIFKDDENLSGKIELWAEFEAHLNRSSHLLLITDYSLRRGSYVRREVRQWLAHHDPNNLIVVLANQPLRFERESDGAKRPELPPPLDDLPDGTIVPGAQINQLRNYRRRRRLLGFFRVKPDDPRMLHARIVAAILGTAPAKVLRQHRRWLFGLSLLPLLALSVFALAQLNSRDATADRERAMAIQLQQTDLVGNGFSGKAIRDATYTDKWFDRANFDRASLMDISIVESTGHNTKFNEASLKNVAFVGATFTGAEFSCAGVLDLTPGQSCTGADLQQVSITAGSRLDDTNFNFAQIDGLQVDGSSLEGATFVGATGADMTITDADIRGARFDLVTIESLTFERVCHDDQTVWPRDMTQIPPSYARSCK